MNLDLITGQVSSPFTRPSGEINVQGLCSVLQIDRAELPKAIGVTRQTVSNYFTRDVGYIKLRRHEARDFFTKLNQVYVLINTVMDEDATNESIVEWFHAPNRALRMKSPRDLVYEKKLDVLIKKLMDVLNAAQGG